MDSLTQAVLGAAIGEAGWRRKLGPKAIVFGAALGTLPDLDVVAALAGDWQMLIHHRGFTHALFFAPIACWPLGWLGHKWAKKGQLGHWVHLAFWALLTHPLLDACTPYGTQLFFPVSRHKVAIDAISIVDPLYTVPLVLALGVAWLTRKKPRVGAWVAAAALVATTAYLGFGLAQSRRAVASFHEALPASFEPEASRAVPSLGNVFGRRALARDADRNLKLGLVSTLTPQPIEVVDVPWTPDPRIDAALETFEGDLVLWNAMGMLSARVEEEDDGGYTVHLDDQRYGSYTDLPRTLWGARLSFDASGTLREAEWLERRDDVDAAAELRALRDLIFGPEGPAQDN